MAVSFNSRQNRNPLQWYVKFDNMATAYKSEYKFQAHIPKNIWNGMFM
jgi:predicted GIY-YIG superfamily endonuclease